MCVNKQGGKIKPFNLEKAMVGKSIVTCDGRKAKFIAYVPKCAENSRGIVLIGDYDCASDFSESGSHCGFKSDHDLFMAEEKTKPAERFKWSFQTGDFVGSIFRAWPDMLTEDEAHKLFLKMPDCISYDKIGAPKKEPVVRWLWAYNAVNFSGQALFGVSPHFYSEKEIKESTGFSGAIKLEWSRTYFPE